MGLRWLRSRSISPARDAAWLTTRIKRELRRRSTVEPVIGHVSRAPHGPKLSRWDPRTAAVIAARRLQLAPLNASRTGLFFPNTVFLSGHGGGRFGEPGKRTGLDPQARISQFNGEDAPFSGHALEGMHSAIGELNSGPPLGP